MLSSPYFSKVRGQPLYMFIVYVTVKSENLVVIESEYSILTGQKWVLLSICWPALTFTRTYTMYSTLLLMVK